MRRTAVFASLLVFVAASAFAGHFIYAPGKPLTDADLAELASQGIVVKRALTGGRFLVFTDSVAPPPSAARIRATEDGGATLEPLTPARKILASAIREAAKGQPLARVRVMFHEVVAFEDASAAVAEAGATFDDPLAFELGVMQQIDVLVPPTSLERLAMDERVFVIGGSPRMKITSHNVNAAALSKVTELHTAPYDLRGAGVVASLFELAEAQGSHPEFGGRMTVNATGGSTSDRQHATHVAGTIGAAGLEPTAKGMAPEVTLHQYRASGTVDVWLKAKDTNLKPLGVVADNNSWGYILGWELEGSNDVWNDLAEYYGAYDLGYTAPIDQITRERGVLFIHSAGNEANPPALPLWGQHKHTDNSGSTITDKTYCFSRDGSGNDCPTPTCTSGGVYCEKTKHLLSAPYDTIGLTASGKNTVTVGSVDESKTIAESSSRGPAKDGRVKPDVVARGVNVLSTSTNSSYVRKSGTSMASPVVTGISVLLTEQWRRTFGVSPTPEQLKALLIAGADDLGNPGPDYTYGYGLVNAKASVDLIRADGGLGTRIKTDKLAQDQRFETTVRVSEAQKLRVTLQWLDPEIVYVGGDDVAAKALVNDLDLTVTDPAGNVVRPYVLNKTAVTATATRDVNITDNTEVVEIDNAAPGLYRVAVNATSVTDRSPQSFTLVTNALAAPRCVDTNEGNNSAESAYGNLSPTQNIGAALCGESDVDFYKLAVTRGGDVTVVVNATGDMPIRATISRDGGASQTVDVPAGQSRTLTLNIPGGALAQAVPVLLRFEPVPGSTGLIPTYNFTPNFGQVVPPRRRATRKL